MDKENLKNDTVQLQQFMYELIACSTFCRSGVLNLLTITSKLSAEAGEQMSTQFKKVDMILEDFIRLAEVVTENMSFSRHYYEDILFDLGAIRLCLNQVNKEAYNNSPTEKGLPGEIIDMMIHTFGMIGGSMLKSMSILKELSGVEMENNSGEALSDIEKLSLSMGIKNKFSA